MATTQVGDGITIGAGDVITFGDSSTQAQAPAGQFISQTTISDDATVDITTGFDNTTYTSYIFIFEDVVPATDDAAIHFRVGDGSFSSAATYDGSQVGAGSTACVISRNDANYGISNVDGEGLSGMMFLTVTDGNTMAVAGYVWNSYMRGGSGTASNTHTGRVCFYTALTELDRIQFYMSSGNVSSGTIKMYGVRKA